MGWAHFGASRVGEDLLGMMGGNGIGFTPPIPSGIYTFWDQQLDDYTDWTGRFVVTEIPGPSALVGLTLAGMGWMSRRRRG